MTLLSYSLSTLKITLLGLVGQEAQFLFIEFMLQDNVKSFPRSVLVFKYLQLIFEIEGFLLKREF